MSMPSSSFKRKQKTHYASFGRIDLGSLFDQAPQIFMSARRQEKREIYFVILESMLRAPTR